MFQRGSSAGRARPVVETLIHREARRRWGQGYPVIHCLSAPLLSPLITPSPLSAQQSPWETNLSSLGEGWRWGTRRPPYASGGPFSLPFSTSLGTDRLQINLAFNSLDFIIRSPSVSFSVCVSLWFTHPFSLNLLNTSKYVDDLWITNKPGANETLFFIKVLILIRLLERPYAVRGAAVDVILLVCVLSDYIYSWRRPRKDFDWRTEPMQPLCQITTITPVLLLCFNDTTSWETGLIKHAC